MPNFTHLCDVHCFTLGQNNFWSSLLIFHKIMFSGQSNWMLYKYLVKWMYVLNFKVDNSTSEKFPLIFLCFSFTLQPFNLHPQKWFWGWFCNLKKRWVYSMNPYFFLGLQPENNPSLQNQFSANLKITSEGAD